jgi:probable H4MPT-linked C1 transfer pathway protein
MNLLSLDIGGANTKTHFVKEDRQESSVTYFPLWKKRNELPHFLKNMREKADLTAVTLTAELCDCFKAKEDGVRFIVSACEKAFVEPLYLTTDKKLIKQRSIQTYNELAGANWLGSRFFMEQNFGEGILVDVGSTTTDVIPFGKGGRTPKTDLERLKAGQLIYTGLLRTPVNTIIDSVDIGGGKAGLASEYFAITADVYNVLNAVDYSCETPDGKGKSKYESKIRLARLLCSDLDEVENYMIDLCRLVRTAQVKKIAKAIKKVSNQNGVRQVYAGGSGYILANMAAESIGLETIELKDVIDDAWNLPCLGLSRMLLNVVENND